MGFRSMESYPDPSKIVHIVTDGRWGCRCRCNGVRHQLVHEHRVVVRIDPRKGLRQLPADQLQRRQRQRPIPHQNREALAPTGGYVGRHQGPQEPSRHPTAAVGHQVDLQPAGLAVIAPSLERAHRHPPPHGAVGPGRAAPAVAAALLADRSQQTVDRGS